MGVLVWDRVGVGSVRDTYHCLLQGFSSECGYGENAPVSLITGKSLRVQSDNCLPRYVLYPIQLQHRHPPHTPPTNNPHPLPTPSRSLTSTLHRSDRLDEPEWGCCCTSARNSMVGDLKLRGRTAKSDLSLNQARHHQFTG